MPLSKDQLRSLYERRARHYDLTTRWLFRLMGARVDRYRRLAVELLALDAGDTVVDLGCGTGLNIAYLEQVVGSEGRVIAVDLTPEMLAEASRRVEAYGWGNVHLVQADLASYAFPEGLAGALSSFAITLVPEYDQVIQTCASALRPGGRLAILDLREPEHWPKPLLQFAAWLNKPYGVSLDLAERHPWESVRRHLREIEFRQLYLGGMYISVGESLLT